MEFAASATESDCRCETFTPAADSSARCTRAKVDISAIDAHTAARTHHQYRCPRPRTLSDSSGHTSTISTVSTTTSSAPTIHLRYRRRFGVSGPFSPFGLSSAPSSSGSSGVTVSFVIYSVGQLDSVRR